MQEAKLAPEGQTAQKASDSLKKEQEDPGGPNEPQEHHRRAPGPQEFPTRRSTIDD